MIMREREDEKNSPRLGRSIEAFSFFSRQPLNLSTSTFFFSHLKTILNHLHQPT